MCGIIGVCSNQTIADEHLDKALQQMVHRGPDSYGLFKDKLGDQSIKLGHNRLSIIDLSDASSQPFTSECGAYTIVFNGEIYNYQQLRASYLSDESFRTGSDTEVLLKLYIHYGENILNSLKGMFAFCIYDQKRQSLFLARDQLGVKPLYYFIDDDQLLFASEITPLFQLGVNKAIDHYALYEFMLNSFIYEPHTGFKDVYKLEAGTFIQYDINKGCLKQHATYWHPQKDQMNEQYQIGDSHKRCPLATLIKDSIRDHVVSDVPVCLFFSGGVDSSLILTEVERRIQPIVVASDKDALKQSGLSDDYAYSKTIARYLNRQVREVNVSDISNKHSLLEAIDQAANLSEEPIADLTIISTLRISEQARQAGYKVALSGMGADEVFAGYPRYRLVAHPKRFCLLCPLLKLLKKHPGISRKLQRLEGFCREKHLPWRYTSILGYFSRLEVAKYFKLFDPTYERRYVQKLNDTMETIQGSSLKKVLYLDIFGFLSHNFLVADKASMQTSLELRVPLATKTLSEYAFNLDDKDLLSAKQGKLPLISFLKNALPKKWLERKKAGFHPPLEKALNELSSKELLNKLNRSGLTEIIDEAYIQRIIAQHTQNKYNHTLKVFQLLYLSSWYEKHFKG